MTKVTKRKIVGYKRIGERTYEIHLDKDIDTMSVYELTPIAKGNSG